MGDNDVLRLGGAVDDLVATSPEHGETNILTAASEATAVVLLLLPSLTRTSTRSPLRRLARATPDIRQLGGHPLAVGPGSHQDAAGSSEHLDLPFPLLAAEPGDSAGRLWPPPRGCRSRTGYRIAVIDRSHVVRQLQRSVRPRGSVDVEGILACLRSLERPHR